MSIVFIVFFVIILGFFVITRSFAAYLRHRVRRNSQAMGLGDPFARDNNPGGGQHGHHGGWGGWGGGGGGHHGGGGGHHGGGGGDHGGGGGGGHHG